MSEKPRSWVVCIVLAFIASGLVGVGSAFAQAHDRPVIAEGEVNNNNVYVRSGDSLNHYTVCKLDAGRRVKIVAERGDWYEILPPEEAFSLISGDYVDSADGKHGVVNGNNVRVRTGSLLNDNKYTVQLLLGKGDEVTILDKNPEGFLKIRPPSGATVWVNRSLVERVPDSLVKLEGETKTGDGTPTTTPATGGAPAATDAAGPSTASPPRRPDTVITKSEALARLDKTPQRDELARIDAAVNVELAKPVLERQLEPFLTRYQTVAQQAQDVVAQNYASARATQISDMMALIATVREMRRLEEAAASKRRGFQEGRAGIRTVTPSAPSGLDAEGVLRRSSLYPEGGTVQRYRLVDVSTPAERTIAYIEIPGNSTVDAEAMIGQYIGVRSSAKRWQQGAVDPMPIYVARELVALDRPDGAAPPVPSTEKNDD